MTRNISVFGDSISTFDGYIPQGNRCYYFPDDPNGTQVTSVDQTWWMQCINRLGGRFLANGSYSGSTVEGVAFPAADSDRRAAQVLGPQGEPPDDILVFIGINDYGWGGADPQVRTLPVDEYNKPDPATLPDDTVKPADAHTVPDFASAYRSMLARLKSAAPHATIYCISLMPARVCGQEKPTFCYQLRGADLTAYNDAIADAATDEGCTFVDISAFGLDYSSSDGTHPNALGMTQFADMVVSALEGHEPNTHLFSPSDASGRNCEKDTCMGCEFARSTGNQWSCVCERYLA